MSGTCMAASLVKKTSGDKPRLIPFFYLFLFAFGVMLERACIAHRLVIAGGNDRRISGPGPIGRGEALGPVATGRMAVEELRRGEVRAILVVELAKQLGGRPRINPGAGQRGDGVAVRFIFIGPGVAARH